MDSLKYCQENKGLEVYAYRIMPSHIHLIFGSNGDMLLTDIIRDLKSIPHEVSETLYKTLPFLRAEEQGFCCSLSRRISGFQRAGKKNSNNNEHQLWQQHSHPIVLDSNLIQLAYIHQNPVEARFVNHAEAWLYSSAAAYAGERKDFINLLYVE